MSEPREWKTLKEAREERGKNGLECQSCGCRDFKVARTVRGGGAICRVRVCRQCGRRFLTSETII